MSFTLLIMSRASCSLLFPVVWLRGDDGDDRRVVQGLLALCLAQQVQLLGCRGDGDGQPGGAGSAGDDAHVPDDLFGYEGDEVLLVDLPHRGDFREVIVKEDIEPYAEQLRGKRLLLLRTGFVRYKFTEPERYANEGVSLHPDFSRYLNEEFPDLVCIGMDFLSIASPTNDYGVEAHRWLLGNYNSHVICAIEDMPLDALADRRIKAITLGPLRIKGIDSSQICAMAWVE